MLETWAAPDLVQLQSELDTMRSTMKLVTTSLVPRGSLTAHDFPPSHTPRRLLEGRGGEAGAGSSPEFHVYSGKTAGRGSVSGAMHPARGGLRLTADGDDGEQDGLVDAGVPKDEEEEEDEDEESDGDGEAMAVDDGAPAATGAAKVLAQSAAESHAATGKAPEKTAGKKTSRGRKPIPAKKQQPLQTPGSTEAAAGGAAAKAAAQTSSGAPKAKGRRKKRTRDSEDDGEGKKAGSSSGGVTYAQNFWSTMETYLRPLTRKDLELLEPVTEQQVQELCVIPPLGKHYLKVWAEEDAELAERHAHDTPGDLMDEYQHPESTPLQAARPASSHTSRHATRQSTAAREGADDSDGETVIDLTQRLMAAVLECPGDTQRPPPVLSLEDEDPVAHRAAVDAGIRSELVALKLLQSGETVSARSRLFPSPSSLSSKTNQPKTFHHTAARSEPRRRRRTVPRPSDAVRYLRRPRPGSQRKARTAV